MNIKYRKFNLLGIFVLTFTLVIPRDIQAGLFGPKGDSTSQKQSDVREQRDEMLTELYASHPEMKKRIKKSAGYATFSQKDINLFLLASGSGYGVLHENKTRREIFMRMASLGGGLGLGVKDVRVIFVFNNAELMRQFVEEGWQFDGKADASAKYKETGLSAEQNVKASVNFQDGTVAAGSSTDVRGSNGSISSQANFALGEAIQIFQFTDSGVSLQATVSGTKYWKDSKLNK